MYYTSDEEIINAYKRDRCQKKAEEAFLTIKRIEGESFEKKIFIDFAVEKFMETGLNMEHEEIQELFKKKYNINEHNTQSCQKIGYEQEEEYGTSGKKSHTRRIQSEFRNSSHTIVTSKKRKPVNQNSTLE